MRAHKLALIMALKKAVDKARRETAWNSANPLVNRDFFVVTNQFVPFLDANNFAYPGRAALAALVALAVVADSWPPPQEVIEEVLKLLRKKIPDPRERPSRAPEIVIAYLLGWPRLDLNRCGARWESGLTEARACLRAVMYESADSCLTGLNEFVIEFPTEDPGYWATRILNLFTSGHRRCDCFLRAAPPGTAAEDVEDLRGDAMSKWKKCRLREHHLSLWKPAEMPLWHFAERAVKGFTGKFTANRVGGFPSGILFDQLWNSGETPGRVKLVRVARRFCDSCERLTVFENCQNPGCDNQPLDPEHAYVATQEFLILLGERGGYGQRSVWTCGGPPTELAAKVKKKEAVTKCGNVYVRKGCDQRTCAETHDCCPLCGTRHPTGRQRKLSTVYFFEGLPTTFVGINAYLAGMLPARPEEEEGGQA